MEFMLRTATPTSYEKQPEPCGILVAHEEVPIQIPVDTFNHFILRT